MPKQETQTFLTGARTALSAFTALSALTALSAFTALGVDPATAFPNDTAPLTAEIQVAAVRAPRRVLPTGAPTAWSSDIEERLQTLREHGRNRHTGSNPTDRDTNPADSTSNPRSSERRQDTEVAQ
jgi:hypothetical protein